LNTEKHNLETQLWINTGQVPCGSNLYCLHPKFQSWLCYRSSS